MLSDHTNIYKLLYGMDICLYIQIKLKGSYCRINAALVHFGWTVVYHVRGMTNQKICEAVM